MSSIAANFAVRCLAGRQRRVRLIPWIVKTRAICSSIGEGGAGEGLVRYIPKKKLEAQVPQNPHMPSFPSSENHHVRNSALRLEGSNGLKSSGRSLILKNSKSQTRNADEEVEKEIDSCEENVKNGYLEVAKVAVEEPRIRQGKMTLNEDAPGPEKDSQSKVPQRIQYMPCPGPEKYVRNTSMDESVLRLEGPGGSRSPVLNEKSQTHYANKEVEEGIYPCEEAIVNGYLKGSKEVVDVPGVCEKKVTSENLQPESPGSMPYVPSLGHVNHVRNDVVGRSAVRSEDPTGRKCLERSPVLDNEPQIRNETPYYADEEMEEEFDHCLKASESECLEIICHGEKTQNKDALEAGKTMQDAEKVAIGLLTKRAYTAVELKKKLLKKKFSLDISDAVIKEFHSRGLISDRLYAEMYSRSRWSSSSWGPRRIKQGLFQKGVSDVDAQNALKLVFEESDSADDEESNLDMSKATMDRLYVQASKQWLRSQDVTDETRKTRIIRWLQYRGFNWGIVKFILKKLESEHRS